MTRACIEMPPVVVTELQEAVRHVVSQLTPRQVWAQRVWLNALLQGGYDVPEPIRPAAPGAVARAGRETRLYRVVTELVDGMPPLPEGLASVSACLAPGVHDGVSFGDAAFALGVPASILNRMMSRQLQGDYAGPVVGMRGNRRLSVVDVAHAAKLEVKALKAAEALAGAQARAARYRQQLEMAKAITPGGDATGY